MKKVLKFNIKPKVEEALEIDDVLNQKKDSFGDPDNEFANRKARRIIKAIRTAEECEEAADECEEAGNVEQAKSLRDTAEKLRGWTTNVWSMDSNEPDDDSEHESHSDSPAERAQRAADEASDDAEHTAEEAEEAEDAAKAAKKAAAEKAEKAKKNPNNQDAEDAANEAKAAAEKAEKAAKMAKEAANKAKKDAERAQKAADKAKAEEEKGNTEKAEDYADDAEDAADDAFGHASDAEDAADEAENAADEATDGKYSDEKYGPNGEDDQEGKSSESKDKDDGEGEEEDDEGESESENNNSSSNKSSASEPENPDRARGDSQSVNSGDNQASDGSDGSSSSQQGGQEGQSDQSGQSGQDSQDGANSEQSNNGQDGSRVQQGEQNQNQDKQQGNQQQQKQPPIKNPFDIKPRGAQARQKIEKKDADKNKDGKTPGEELSEFERMKQVLKMLKGGEKDGAKAALNDLLKNDEKTEETLTEEKQPKQTIEKCIDLVSDEEFNKVIDDAILKIRAVKKVKTGKPGPAPIERINQTLRNTATRREFNKEISGNEWQKQQDEIQRQHELKKYEVSGVKSSDYFRYDLRAAFLNQLDTYKKQIQSWNVINRRTSGTDIIKRGTQTRQYDEPVKPSLRVYLDCSSSFSEDDIKKEKEFMSIIADLEAKGEIKKTVIKYHACGVFSDYYSARHTCGNTDGWPSILRDIKKNPCTNVLIITDSDLNGFGGQCGTVEIPGYAWFIWKRRMSPDIVNDIKAASGSSQYMLVFNDD